MKLANPIGLLLLAMVALTLGTVGCRKNPDRLTKIDGYGPTGRVGDPEEAKPFPSANPVLPERPISSQPLPPTTGATPTTTEGFPAGPGHDGWTENREEFAAQVVYFAYDQHAVRPGEVSKLEEVVRRMKSGAMRGKALRIEGHCDERGTEEYNRSLGDRRALSIREWLVGHGMTPDQVDTVSFGEDKPVDTGHTEAAFQKNRRGEIILLSRP